MLKTVLLLFLVYIAYRFIFGFVIPVSRAARSVRQQFKDAQNQMQAQMEAQMQARQGFGETHAEAAGKSSQHSTPVLKSDYIDYEEVK